MATTNSTIEKIAPMFTELLIKKNRVPENGLAKTVDNEP